MTYWKFIKNKKGFEITKKEGDLTSYSLGTINANMRVSLMHIAQHFQENDIIDTGNAKEDLVFWDEDYKSIVLVKKGHTNCTVWFPRTTGRSIHAYMGEN